MNNSNKKYRHLNQQMRFVIQHLYKQKKSICKIAKELNVSPSTISRELKRNFDSEKNEYNCEFAEQKRKERILDSRKLEFTEGSEYYEYTLEFVNLFDKDFHGVKTTHYAIVKKFKGTKFKVPCIQTVYNWINSGIWVITRDKCLRLKYCKPRKPRINYNFSRIIAEKYVLHILMRPEKIASREEFGHWEIDTIQSAKTRGHDLIITFVERMSRKIFVTRINNKNSLKAAGKIYQLIRKNNLNVKSITCDNGREFESIGLVAYWLEIKAYKCDPYASHQRGTVENANGIIRRAFPKGSNFTNIGDQELQEIVDKINNMPREILGWKSANDKYNEEN